MLMKREHPRSANAPVTFLLLPAAGPSLLLYLSLGLIGVCLLLFQRLLGALIRFRRRNVSRGGLGIGSLRQTAGALLLRQFTHAVLQPFAEVVVHLLQIVQRQRTFLSYRAIRFVAGDHFHLDVFVVIRSICGSLHYVAIGETTLFTLGHHQ